MRFQPKILHPDPDPHFVRELMRIDPNLRVVFGYDRYMKNVWVIERRMSAERYAACYASLLLQGVERFTEQPIFDTDQPEYNQDGERIGFRVVGTRRFDLAPEWEYIMSVEEPDGSYRQLDSRTLMELKRQYAWNFNQPLSRRRFEEKQERERLAAAKSAERADELFQEIMDHKREIWNLPFSGQPEPKEA